MSLNPTSSSLHLALPSSSAQARTPTNITVHPAVIASILAHHARQPSSTPSASAEGSASTSTSATTTQPRVLGALLGQRSENGAEVDVRNCYAVPHSEDENTVALDMPFQQSMAGLMGKLGAKEVIVGWYATSSTINAYSALIQNYFSNQTLPFPAVHLTIDTALTASGDGLGVKGYSSLPIGTADPKPENCVFLPVPVGIKFAQSERAGLDLITSTSPSSPSTAPLPTLGASLDQLLALLDQSIDYVSSVNSGKTQPDEQVRKYLLEAVGRWAPSVGGTEEEGGVKAGVQDTLSVAYLASLVRMQVELGGRLGLLQQAQTQ